MKTCARYTLLVVAFMLAGCGRNPVQYTTWRPEADYPAVPGERYSIQIPSQWKISPKESKGPRYLDVLLDEAGHEVFQIVSWEGGNEHLKCQCAPREDYEYTDTGRLHIWSIRLQAPDLGDFSRTWQVAGKRYRLDIHATYENRDRGMMDYIIESAKPIE